MTRFAEQCQRIEQAGEIFLLHPQKVMYWPARKILFAADIHVGKEHVFARQGIGIPTGISESTLRRLFDLASHSGASSLIVLGDFLHAVPHSREKWLSCLSNLLTENAHISMEIVAGNHDAEAGRKLIDERITWHESNLSIEPLVLQHEPGSDSRGYVLCGHLHPVWRVGNRRRGSIRAPVFWFRECYAVLPAFGEFTGGAIIEPNKLNDRLFMTGPDCVIPVPADLRRRH